MLLHHLLSLYTTINIRIFFYKHILNLLILINRLSIIFYNEISQKEGEIMKEYLNTQPFETLIKGKAPKSRDHKWYPTSINDYRKAFKIDTSTSENKALLNNICCNMQYLELLEKKLSELELSAVLRSLTIKNYIITSMSILEGLFTNIVKINGLWNKIDKKAISEANTNEIDYDDKRILIRNTIIEKIPKYYHRKDSRETC